MKWLRRLSPIQFAIGSFKKSICLVWQTLMQWPAKLVELLKTAQAVGDRNPLYLFLCLFFCIWHPGIHQQHVPSETRLAQPQTTIPPRPQIYPLQNVRLKIAQKVPLLTLTIDKKIVAVFPTRSSLLPVGQYKIISMESTAQQAILAYAQHLSQPHVIVCKAENTHTALGAYWVEVEDDYWEMVVPYLRVGTPVLVE